MFWKSRWKYSGVPGCGPAAFAVPAVSAPVAASATSALSPLPIAALRFAYARRSMQDRTVRCLTAAPGTIARGAGGARGETEVTDGTERVERDHGHRLPARRGGLVPTGERGRR